MNLLLLLFTPTALAAVLAAQTTTLPTPTASPTITPAPIPEIHAYNAILRKRCLDGTGPCNKRQFSFDSDLFSYDPYTYDWSSFMISFSNALSDIYALTTDSDYLALLSQYYTATGYDFTTNDAYSSLLNRLTATTAGSAQATGGFSNGGSFSGTTVKKKKKAPVGAIVGGVVGGLVVIAAVVGIIIFVCARKRTPKPQTVAQAQASQGVGLAGAYKPPLPVQVTPVPEKMDAPPPQPPQPVPTPHPNIPEADGQQQVMPPQYTGHSQAGYGGGVQPVPQQFTGGSQQGQVYHEMHNNSATPAPGLQNYQPYPSPSPPPQPGVQYGPLPGAVYHEMDNSHVQR